MWELNGSTSAITAAVAIPGEFVWASRDGTVQAAGETLNTRVVVRHGTPVLGIVTAVPGDVVSWDYRGFVRVTDLESGGVVHAMRAHDGPVTACAPGPGQLFTGSAEGAIRVWSGVIAVSVIDLSPDGDEAAGGAVRALRARLRDGIRQGRSEIEFPLRQPSRAAAVERIKALTGLDLRQRGGMRSSVRVKLDGEVHHFGVTVTAETGGERAVFATDKPEERAVTLEGHAAAVTSLVWSDYLRQLLSTSDDGTVRAWDPAEGREAAVLRGHESAVLGCLAMFQTASALTWSRDHTLRLWDVGAGKEVRRFSGHHGAVLGARLLPDARLLSWSADQTVRLWDVNTGATLAVLEGHAAAVNGALLLPDDRVVSWSDDRTIRFWTMDGALIDPDSASQSASTPAMPRIVKPRGIVGVSPAAILECVVHADSTTATCLAATRVWRDGLATGQETDVFDTPRKDAETGSSAPLLGLAIGDNDSVVATWSAAETFVRRPSDAEHVYLSDTVVDAMLPIEGGRLATARRNFDGAWVDLGPTESEPSSDRIHYGPRNGRAHWIAAVGPGRVACGWSDGAVALYADATAGGPRFSLLGAHAGDASSGTASPDGQLLATAGADLSIRLWALGGAETFSGRLLATLEGHTDVVTALAITPDAQRVITTSRDRTVRIWSISEARLLETILDHRDWVTHVAVNPAGTRMATTSSDRTIKLWSLDTYDCLGTAYGHHRFLCLAMSDDVVCAGDAGGDFWILDYDAPAEAAAEARFSRRYVVSGRLAGLFFRTFARDAAVRLGLAGEVRNLRDGRVEVIATGDARQHAELKQALSTGPRSGTVDGIEEEVIPLRDGDGFTVS
jgi:WD40 repeat protein/acylphosphatase